MAKKRGKGITIKINLTNRWLYTFILIGIIILLGIVVYAYTNPTTGVGHDYNEIQPCADGQVLGMVAGIWTCVDMWNETADTRCDTSGTCSQVCIGSDCQLSWGLKTKIINIGDWNMVATSSAGRPHGLSLLNIRDVQAIIRDDSDGLYLKIDSSTYAGAINGNIFVTSSAVSMTRREGGGFDSTNYDETSFNRGWILITYEE